MAVDSNFVLEVFRSEYARRLTEVIGETDAFDDEGNLLLSPDLKVRHKDSGLEYTIDRVEGEDSDIQIFLRLPEEPRVEPAPEERELLWEPRSEDILGEQDPASDLPALEPTEDSDEEVVFVIDQEEFEKDYEVDWNGINKW